MLQSFHFLRPAALLLGPLAVGIWWLWQCRADPLRGWRAQVDPALLEALTDHPDNRPNRHVWLLTAWLLASIAIAGPSWKPVPSPFAEDATPLILLLKVDTSMDTPDPLPSRIERARLKITDLAEARPGQPMGLIAYAGTAHLVLPPTRDTAVVAIMAAEISPEMMPEPGDRLDLALDRSADLIRSNGGNGTILVITDTATSATPALSESYRAAGSPFTQILAIGPAGNQPDPLRPLARALDADLVAMTDDNADVARIVRGAARPPVSRSADGTERWQDAGYFIVPILAVFALLPFRRESRTPKAA